MINGFTVNRPRAVRLYALAATVAVLVAVCGAVTAGAQQSESAATAAHELPYTVSGGKVDRRTYVGWRLFHSTCHLCHGVDATGTSVAPDLTARVGGMSEEDFINAVLYRYPIIVGFGTKGEGDLPALRRAFVAAVKRHERGGVLMPAWEDDPNVKPHVLDLYAYLRARADGALGTGRPARAEAASPAGRRAAADPGRGE